MSLSNVAENALALLVFNAVTWNNIAENDTTSPATDFDVALHTADPGEAGNMTTNEAAYTSYARQTVARTAGGWTIATSNVSNTAAVTFPQATGGSETESHFSIGFTGGGATDIIAFGPVDTPLAVSVGITPEFAIGALDVDWD